MIEKIDFDPVSALFDFINKAKEHLPIILIYILFFFIFTLIARLILIKVEFFIINKTKVRARSPGEYEKRLNTLSGVLNKFVYIIIWACAFMVIVARMGMDTAPLLALTGIFGIAIGFGSQSLVKDIIGGILILLENQIRIGDVSSVNGTRGLVEAINWRTIILRDVAGAVHVFPNGSVTALANLTKEWSAYVFDVGVAYKENVDNVISVITEVGGELEKDNVYGEKIIEPVEVFGLDKFDDSAIIIKGRIKTLPRQQRAVGREFNRRIKIEFDRRGISIPFPHRRLYMGTPSEKLEVLVKKEEKKNGV